MCATSWLSVCYYSLKRQYTDLYRFQVFRFLKDANGKIAIEPLKDLSFIKSGWGTRPLLKLRRGSVPPPASAPPSSLLQHSLKCCVHLHLERHIEFAPMSNLVVLGWAHEKNDFWGGRYHKLTFTLSLDGRSFHWHCFIVLFMVHLVDTVSS